MKALEGDRNRGSKDNAFDCVVITWIVLGDRGTDNPDFFGVVDDVGTPHSYCRCEVCAFIPDFRKRSLGDADGNDMCAKFVPGEGAVERFDLGASKSNCKDDREF